MNVIVAQDGKEVWSHRVHLLMIARCHVPELPPIQTAAVALGGYRSTNILHKEDLSYHHWHLDAISLLVVWSLYRYECVIQSFLVDS